MKKILIEMGLTQEQADKVVGQIESRYISRSNYDQLQTEVEQLRGSVTERDAQLKELKKIADGHEGLQNRITELEKANKDAQTRYTTELTDTKIKYAARDQLRNAGAISATAVMPFLNLKDAKLSDDEKSIVGLDNQIQALKSDEKRSFLFSSSSPAAPSFKGIAPGAAADAIPDAGLAGYQARYLEAKQKNDKVGAIAIKREAHTKGYQL